MRILTSWLEPRERKYIEGYGFLSFAKNLVNKQITKKLTDAGKEFGKTAGKKILNKSAEATGDLIGSKIADKIVKAGKSEDEIYISPEKRKQIMDDMRLL